MPGDVVPGLDNSVVSGAIVSGEVRSMYPNFVVAVGNVIWLVDLALFGRMN